MRLKCVERGPSRFRFLTIQDEPFRSGHVRAIVTLEPANGNLTPHPRRLHMIEECVPGDRPQPPTHITVRDGVTAFPSPLERFRGEILSQGPIRAGLRQQPSQDPAMMLGVDVCGPLRAVSAGAHQAAPSSPCSKRAIRAAAYASLISSWSTTNPALAVSQSSGS